MVARKSALLLSSAALAVCGVTPVLTGGPAAAEEGIVPTSPAAAASAGGFAAAGTVPEPLTWAPGLPPAQLPPAMNGADLARTPPMGWNNWAHYGCKTDNPYAGHEGVSEQLFRTVADNLVSGGLAAKGYKSVNIDDCWMTNKRDSKGDLSTNTDLFPSGMKALGDYIHAKGLKYGIYNDAGFATCAGQSGSEGHFAADAKLFARYGVDYVKMDGCNVTVPAGKTRLQAYVDAYTAMSKALADTGRPMVHSQSEPGYVYIGVENKSDWYSALLHSQQTGQLWREGDDGYVWTPRTREGDGWGFVQTNYNYNWPLARYSQANSWNDPDFLLAGDNSLTLDQQKTQFALWSMMASPLIISNDANKLTDSTTVSILGNTDIIAIDQDRLGAAASVVKRTPTADVLSRPLANGDRAVALFNNSGSQQTLSTTLAQLGYTTQSRCSFTVKDLWAGTSATYNAKTAISATLPANATAIYRVSASYGCGTTTATIPITGPINTKAGCVTVADSKPGTAATVGACTGAAGQRLTLPGDGTIRNGSSCLASTGREGAAVKLAACDASAGQKWT